MASFIEGFAKGFGEARDRSLKREMFLGEQKDKKKAAIDRIRPQILTQAQKEKEIAAQLTYLEEERKLPVATVNALAQNPDQLKAAYEYATTNPDIPTDILSNVFQAKPLGGQEVEHWKVGYENNYSVYQGFLDGTLENPEEALMQLNTPRPITAAVEVRMPKKPEVTPEETRRWAEQEQAFNNQVVVMGQRYLNNLVTKIESNQATEAEIETLATLRRDLNSYGKPDAVNATLNIRKLVGQMALESLKNAPNIDQDVLVGIENNPRIFLVGEDQGLEFTAPKVTEAPKPDSTAPDHVYEVDGKIYHYFERPDGKYTEVRVK